MNTVITRALTLLLLATALHAQVPQLINYQGRVAVGAANFDGSGQFKFALVNPNGTTTYWSNNGSSSAGSQPSAAVTLTVTKGLYSVLLGDASLANMTAIPGSVFSHGDVRLRVWFNDGTNGSQLLTPDQRLAPNGYLPDGSVSFTAIADGAVHSMKIAPGAIATVHLAGGAVSAAKLGSDVGLWSANGAHVFRNSGNVGINKINPDTALDVNGTVTATGFSGSGAALTSLNAANLTGFLSDARLSTNVALLSVNQTFTGTVTATAFNGNGTGLANVNALTLGGLSSSSFWKPGGNAGTTASTHFLGTTDDQPLELKVNGARALRLEPKAGGASNVIGGAPDNFAGPGIVGATIGGGGALSYAGNAYTNQVTGDFGTVGGGADNESAATAATVGGGLANTAGGLYSTVGGGFNNVSGGFRSTIGGGSNNISSEDYTTAGGGYGNVSSGYSATVGGGYQNTSNGSRATVGGGEQNTSSNNYATVPGGHLNSAGGSYSFAAGRRAKANHSGAFVWADSQDANFTSTAANQFLIRAAGNVGINKPNPATELDVNGTVTATGLHWAASSLNADQGGSIELGDPAGGGTIPYIDFHYGNGTSEDYNVRLINNANGQLACESSGGSVNFRVAGTVTASGFSSNAGTPLLLGTTGGQPLEFFVNGTRALRLEPTPEGYPNVIGGAPGNFVVAGTVGATIGGGRNGGGSSGDYSTVGGGDLNSANGDFSTVGGGQSNSATGNFSTVPGGQSNVAAGEHSLAAGFSARADHDGAFVWADSIGTDLHSAAANSVTMRAWGGYRLFSSDVAGVSLATNGTAWAVISDRNVKKDFSPVDQRAILEKLAAMPITQWHYQWETSEVTPHIGPMAQDFKAAFYPGTDDKTITTQEADGVALAAIQGLNQKLEERLQEKDTRIAALELRLEKLERLMARESAGGR